MNTKIIFLSSLISMLFLFGCQSSNSNQDKTEKVENIPAISNEDKFENLITSVDNNEELSMINSLAYNNNAGSSIEVIAYLDKNDNEVKIEEKFSDIKSGNIGKYTYYIENGKKVVSKEVYLDNVLKKPSYVERITFYDSNNKPIYTKERFATYEDELEKEAFQVTTPKDRSIDRAMRVLNQEKEFETTFQGFANAGNMDYLLIGENTKDGYASSLAVQYKEGDIQKLMKNQKAMIGTPLAVQHQVMVDERGLKFQILISVKIK